jgi:hypothetical protein
VYRAAPLAKALRKVKPAIAKAQYTGLPSTPQRALPQMRVLIVPSHEPSSR